jgi:hypothetical protein
VFCLILFCYIFRSALLEQMPLMEVNRTKEAIDGEDSGESLLNTDTVERNNMENIRSPTSTQTEVHKKSFCMCIILFQVRIF